MAINKTWTSGLSYFMTQAAKRKGKELAKNLDFTKKIEDFKWDVYNSACLGCSRRISPPGMKWSMFERKYVMNLCSGRLKRCPAIPLFEQYRARNEEKKECGK